MGYGVRKFPSSTDPREIYFCVVGYANGAVPPYLYKLSSAGALAPFDILHSGVVLPIVGNGQDHYEAFGNPTWSGDPSFSLVINGYHELQTTPVDHTIWISFACTAPGGKNQTREVEVGTQVGGSTDKTTH